MLSRAVVRGWDGLGNGSGGIVPDVPVSLSKEWNGEVISDWGRGGTRSGSIKPVVLVIA